MRRALRVVGRGAATAALLLGAYPLAGWIGSSIPVNARWVEPADGVRLLIGDNGVHTVIVVPLTNPDFDWRAIFPASDLADPAAPYTDLGLSWGDRTVFLDTPTWSDLRPQTMLRVIFGGGEALLHVDHYIRPAADADFRPLVVGHAQYRAIVRSVLASRSPNGARYRGYGAADAFYDARGRYTLVRTCNEWTGATLRGAGVRIGAWTPFAGGAMKWIPPPPA